MVNFPKKYTAFSEKPPKIQNLRSFFLEILTRNGSLENLSNFAHLGPRAVLQRLCQRKFFSLRHRCFRCAIACSSAAACFWSMLQAHLVSFRPVEHSDFSHGATRILPGAAHHGRFLMIRILQNSHDLFFCPSSLQNRRSHPNITDQVTRGSPIWILQWSRSVPTLVLGSCIRRSMYIEDSVEASIKSQTWDFAFAFDLLGTSIILQTLPCFASYTIRTE